MTITKNKNKGDSFFTHYTSLQAPDVSMYDPSFKTNLRAGKWNIKTELFRQGAFENIYSDNNNSTYQSEWLCLRILSTLFIFHHKETVPS